MSWKRQIKYQLESYKRTALGILHCMTLPSWLTARAARYAYLGIISIIVIAYICQTSNAAASGYEMRDLQNKVTQMREEIQKIEVDIAGYNSMPNLEKQVKSTGMSLAQNIRYISVPEPVVAKR